MKFQYIENEFTFELELDVVIGIIVVNRLLCEEYSIKILASSPIFDNRKIISNPDILYKILCDTFEKKSKCSTISYSSSGTPLDESGGKRVFEITIMVDAVYISDQMIVKLPLVDKHITPKQVVERIDFRFGELIPIVDQKLATIRSDLTQSMTSIVDRQQMSELSAKNLAEHLGVLEGTITNLDSLKSDLSLMEKSTNSIIKEFELYVQMQPIMLFICSNTPAKCSHGPCQIIVPMLCDTKKLVLNANNDIPNDSIGKVFPLPLHNPGRCWHPSCTTQCSSSLHPINFDWIKFKYLTQLEELTIIDQNHENLWFLKGLHKLTTLTLQNVTLPSIACVKYCEKLQYLKIVKTCKIKDLHILTDCPELKLLELPTGTNTGCFPKEINFEIKMC